MNLKWLIFLIKPLDLIGIGFSKDHEANTIKNIKQGKLEKDMMQINYIKVLT